MLVSGKYHCQTVENHVRKLTNFKMEFLTMLFVDELVSMLKLTGSQIVLHGKCAISNFIILLM